MTEGESVDCRYKLVNSNVTIKKCVTLVGTGGQET